MAQETFETFIARERDRLSKKREDILGRQRKLEEELDGIERELLAIDAYEAAKRGKLPGRRRASGGTRAPRGERKAKVLAALSNRKDGMTRGDVIEALGVKGDKSGEAGVSAALASLKKSGEIGYDDNAKKYLPA